MRLNPHLHIVALDGVYVASPDGQPVFRPLGRLKTDEVADVVQVTKARVLKAARQAPRRCRRRRSPQKPPPSGKRCRYIKWAELLRLTFGLTVDQCLPAGAA